MSPLDALILGLYFFILAIVAIYGWHRYFIVYLYMKHKHDVPRPAGRFETLPVVTIQLPI